MKRLYGASLLHLLTLIAAFALIGYVIYVAGIETFWNQSVWWQSIAVWFAGAVIVHDLVLFPLYALADRVLRHIRIPHAHVPLVNYIRVPALGSALTFVLFFPGIIQQGSETYRAATGLTQDPYLLRWSMLTTAMFAVSTVVFAIRQFRSRRSS